MHAFSKPVAVIGIFVLTFVLNLFFGYFRAKTKKYSFSWFLYIHLPIPAVFLARTYSGLDYRFIPVFLFAAVIGQIAGGKLELLK
jgi:hypothetical protein